MKRVGKGREVIKAFVDGELAPCRNSQGSLFFQDDVLYSYGHHFPLAFRKVRGTSKIVVNGDKFSVTTSGHQKAVLSVARGKCTTISLTAFRAAGLSGLYYHIDLPFYIDSTPDLVDGPQKKTLLKDFDMKTLPVGATLNTWKNDVGEIEVVSWHRAGMSLWDNDGKYYIAGMDETQYFVSLLPGKPRTCAGALEQLKPTSVQRMEQHGLTVMRQGDWFFADITDFVPEKEIKLFWKSQKPDELKSTYDRPNTHVHKADRLGHVIDVSRESHSVNAFCKMRIYPTTTVVSGRVTHPEHKIVRLGARKDCKLWVAVQNTAKGNWSAGGRVD
jgi:hypothetical protein